MTFLRALLSAMALLAIAVLPASASFAPVPTEVLVDEAAIIVQGKVTKIEDAKFTRLTGNFERKYDAAVVEVAAVLKGPAKLKEVRIAQPAAGGGLAVSTDIRFSPNQEGIWLLKRDKLEADVYWATHPSQFQPLKEKDALAKLVEIRDKLPGGKPVDGLVARAETVQQGNNVEIRFSLKNVSEKPITVFNFVGAQPLQVDWIGPDGKKRDSQHYKWLETARLRAPNEENFVTLAPGGVLFVGPGVGGSQGITLTKLEAGEHKVTVSYVNKEDGKQFKQKDVWVGAVVANEVAFTVK